MQILTILIFSLFFAFFCSWKAEKRGRSPSRWFLSGFLFGILAVITLFLLPKKQPAKRKEEIPPLPVKPSMPIAFEGIWYYLDALEKSQGPIYFTELRSLWRQGEMKESTLVWQQGEESWRQVKEVPHLIENLNGI